MPGETRVEYTINRLNNIALKNDDDLRFQIVPYFYNGAIRYEFTCFEFADGNTFVSATADTIQEAAFKAEQQIESSLKSWGYTE